MKKDKTKTTDKEKPPQMKIVVYKDGSYVLRKETWEYENDKDWLVTIELPVKEQHEKP